MKKFLSIFIAMMLVLNSTAFADDFDFLKASYTSCEAEFEMSMNVGGGLDFLNAIPQMEYIRNYVDLNGLAKGLSESEYTGKLKFNANEEFTKMQASFEVFSKVPLKVNKNLKVTTESVYGMWIDYDITDENAPKLDYIYASPMLDKYLYIDLVSVIENNGNDIAEYISLIKNMTGKEGRKEITDKMVEVIKNNSNVSGRGSKVTITITDEQMKELIVQAIDIAKESVQKVYKENSTYQEEIDDAFSGISEFLDKIQIFADEAAVIEYNKNADGTIKSVNEKINLAIDLNSIAEATGGTMITEDSAIIKYSLFESANYSKINKSVTVDFPKLTEDNSIDFDELNNNLYYQPDYDWDGDNCWHEENIYLYGDYIPTDESGLYCSLNSFVDNLSRYGYDFDVKKDSSFVTVTEENGLERFTEAKISLDSPSVWIDGEEYSADNKAILSDGKVYVDLKTLELIFGASPNYATIYLDKNQFNASFSRKSPQCHHTQEEIDSQNDTEYEDDYCEHFQHVYTYDDRPYRGKQYFILRDVVEQMFDYEGYIDHDLYYALRYDNGVVTLTDLYGKERFNTVIIKNGSNEINIDGNIFYADAPVEIENGTTYIDSSAVNAIFGAEINYSTLEYNNKYFDDELGMNIPSRFLYHATLTRKLPTCTHGDITN
ncbi:MAG: copper amine oxidase N-terminal domain-containing protein [Firmicutes bacterium]|nr:copper amine oxidase N-terminal domain-containing protein [Bacillota bacterium]